MKLSKLTLLGSLFIGVLLLISGCRAADTPVPTATLTLETAPTPALSPSPAFVPAAEPTPLLMLTEQTAYIEGSAYAVIESSIVNPWPKCCLSFSPDGQKITFGYHTATEQKIYVQNIDGSGLKELSSLIMPHGDGPFPDPVWSPDARRIAFVHFDHLYVVEPDGTNLTRLEPEGFEPAWSPDGQSLAFTVHSEKGLAIGVMNPDGSDFRQLTNFEAYDQRPVWSPDGKQIAFISNRDGNREIYVMNSDGSNQRRLTNSTAQEWGPVFSPDGRYIVFSSDRDGHTGIYVMNRDGAEQTWLMASDMTPRWHPDTTRVRFVEAVQNVPPLPEEISQSVAFTLAQQFRVKPDEIELVSWHQTTWPNGCLGIGRRQPCPQGETPGYRLRLKIKGTPYEFRSPTTDPLNLRLAVGPAVNIEVTALLWEGEPALFGGAEAGSCLSFTLSAAGRGALGACDGPQRAVELTGEQFAQPQLWQDWLTRFAPFEVDTSHGRVVFQGQGAETASPAWQRALAAWAKLAALELNDGRSGASWGAALAWQQALSDRPGYCQFLSVQSYGWAYTSTALCEGGDPQNLGQGWIEPSAWEKFDDWLYNRAPVTTESVSFFGAGSQAMSQNEISALEQWASTLYTNQSPQSQPRDRLTFFPLPQEEGYIRDLAVNPDGRLWVAGAINLYLFDPSGSTPTWTNVTATNGGPAGVESLLVDEQGRLWVGSGNGVSLFNGETWMSYGSADGLTGGRVLALVADSNGDIWTGTDKGLSRFDGQSWRAVEGAPVPALSLAIDQTGRLWVGSADGVHMLDSSTWTAYPYAGDFALMYVNAIAPDPAGNIWVASGACFLAPGDCTNTGLSKFDGQNWTNYLQTYFRDFSGIGPILAVNFDQTGVGWVGADAQFMKFNPQTLPPGAQEDNPAWTSYHPESFEQAGQAHTIVFDQTGNAWVGILNGVIQVSQE